jgi:hypothetical protein
MPFATFWQNISRLLLDRAGMADWLYLMSLLIWLAENAFAKNRLFSVCSLLG